MQKLVCWHCKQKLSTDYVSFRTSCDHCFQDQHVCLNCKHYSPSKPNSCEILTTESVKEKDKLNFCEDFYLKDLSDSEEKNFDKVKKLFGDDLPTKKTFKDLFEN